MIILTDDQDLHMDSIGYMPLLKKHLTDHGTFFKATTAQLPSVAHRELLCGVGEMA